MDSYLAEQIQQTLYEEKMRKISNERTALENQIAQTAKNSGNPESTLEPIKNVFLRANRAKEEFLGSSEQGKREMIEILLWNLFIKDKNIVDYQFKSEYQILANAPKNADFLTLGAVVEDVRTVLERLDDVTIYIPDLRPRKMV